MLPENINHVLRAVADITKHRKFVIVGSAAVIARLRGDVSDQMMMTDEVDIYAFDAPNVEDLSDMIDGSIGQDSPFHATHGFYADGVSPDTAQMPTDWLSRAIQHNPLDAPGVTAILPDVNDIALAKLVAWREKDIDWLTSGILTRALSLDVMQARVPSMPTRHSSHATIEQKLQLLQARVQHGNS